jgi:hypothetical protein
MTKEALAQLRLKAEKATKGEWWSDSIGNEGAYGSGDDCAEGFTSYAVYDENDRVLLDTLNSSAACIQEEYDEEGHVAWDEVGQRNAEFIAAANPATVLALMDALEAKDKRIADLERANTAQDDHINQQADRIESLERKNGELGQVCYDRLREIAELQSRAESAEQPRVLNVILPATHTVTIARTPIKMLHKERMVERLKAACELSGITLQIQGGE